MCVFPHHLHLNIFYSSSLNDAIYKLYIFRLLTSSCKWHINSSNASCTLVFFKWWTHGIQSDIFLWTAEFLKCFGGNTVVTLARFYLYCKYGFIYFTSAIKMWNPGDALILQLLCDAKYTSKQYINILVFAISFSCSYILHLGEWYRSSS